MKGKKSCYICGKKSSQMPKPFWLVCNKCMEAEKACEAIEAEADFLKSHYGMKE